MEETERDGRVGGVGTRLGDGGAGKVKEEISFTHFPISSH